MPHQRVGELDLWWEEWGAGEPVLLLHGLGSSGRDWEHQIPSLAARYRVIALDVRGHGRSTKPAGPYRMADVAGEVDAFCEALGLGAVHVVGISMGGMLGFQLAVDAPARVRSLVAINAGPELVPRTLKQWLQLKVREWVLGSLGLRAAARLIGGRLFPEPAQAALRAQFVERWVQNDARAYGAAMAMISGWSVANRLDRVRCPVLLVAAEHDYTPVAMKAAFLDRIPTARLEVVPGSRHATTHDQPERLNALLLEALERAHAG